jgi:hypothetical protein
VSITGSVDDLPPKSGDDERPLNKAAGRRFHISSRDVAKKRGVQKRGQVIQSSFFALEFTCDLDAVLSENRTLNHLTPRRIFSRR